MAKQENHQHYDAQQMQVLEGLKLSGADQECTLAVPMCGLHQLFQRLWTIVSTSLLPVMEEIIVTIHPDGSMTVSAMDGNPR